MDILCPIHSVVARDREVALPGWDIFRPSYAAIWAPLDSIRDKINQPSDRGGRKPNSGGPLREDPMDKVSLTYFVDFVLRSGTPKITGVREYKTRKDELSSDFYRSIREGIVTMHRKGMCESVLDEILAKQTDEKRRRIYPLVTSGYRKFLATGEKRWFTPPQGEIQLGPLAVNLNPEVGFLIGRKPHSIKLYFRQEPLTSKRSSLVLALMAAGLGRTYPEHVFAMLDVQRCKLHTIEMPHNPRLEVLLRGEAASFSTIYDAV